MAFAAHVILAQPPRPGFEVTTVKANNGCGAPGRGGGGLTSPGRMTLECAQLRDLILTAYGIYGDGSGSNPRAFRMQVLGGPGWIDSDRYDVAAKAEGNPPRTEMYGAMLQGLLEDRFKLKLHRETREAPVYVLTAAKGGARLQATKEGGCISTDLNHPLPQPAPGQPRPRACGSQVTGPEGTFDLYGATMANFCTQLGIRLDRDVIDKTGITGMFDIHLEVSPRRPDAAIFGGRSGGARRAIDARGRDRRDRSVDFHRDTTTTWAETRIGQGSRRRPCDRSHRAANCKLAGAYFAHFWTKALANPRAFRRALWLRPRRRSGDTGRPSHGRGRASNCRPAVRESSAREGS